MAALTPENTNTLAHTVAGDSLMYDCPNCEYGEVPVTALIESADAACLDCGSRYRLSIDPVEGDEADDGRGSEGA